MGRRTWHPLPHIVCLSLRASSSYCNILACFGFISSSCLPCLTGLGIGIFVLFDFDYARFVSMALGRVLLLTFAWMLIGEREVHALLLADLVIDPGWTLQWWFAENLTENQHDWLPWWSEHVFAGEAVFRIPRSFKLYVCAKAERMTSPQWNCHSMSSVCTFSRLLRSQTSLNPPPGDPQLDLTFCYRWVQNTSHIQHGNN